MRDPRHDDPSADCPAAATLADLARGRLSGDAATRVDRHVRDCRDCQGDLALFRSQPENDAAPGAPWPAPAQVSPRLARPARVAHGQVWSTRRPDGAPGFASTPTVLVLGSVHTELALELIDVAPLSADVDAATDADVILSEEALGLGYPAVVRLGLASTILVSSLVRHLGAARGRLFDDLALAHEAVHAGSPIADHLRTGRPVRDDRDERALILRQELAELKPLADAVQTAIERGEVATRPDGLSRLISFSTAAWQALVEHLDAVVTAEPLPAIPLRGSPAGPSVGAEAPEPTRVVPELGAARIKLDRDAGGTCVSVIEGCGSIAGDSDLEVVALDLEGGEYRILAPGGVAMLPVTPEQLRFVATSRLRVHARVEAGGVFVMPLIALRAGDRALQVQDERGGGVAHATLAIPGEAGVVEVRADWRGYVILEGPTCDGA